MFLFLYIIGAAIPFNLKQTFIFLVGTAQWVCMLMYLPSPFWFLRLSHSMALGVFITIDFHNWAWTAELFVLPQSHFFVSLFLFWSSKNIAGGVEFGKIWQTFFEWFMVSLVHFFVCGCPIFWVTEEVLWWVYDLSYSCNYHLGRSTPRATRSVAQSDPYNSIYVFI